MNICCRECLELDDICDKCYERRGDYEYEIIEDDEN
jgi:hypothetical protein